MEGSASAAGLLVSPPAKRPSTLLPPLPPASLAVPLRVPMGAGTATAAAEGKGLDSEGPDVHKEEAHSLGIFENSQKYPEKAPSSLPDARTSADAADASGSAVAVSEKPVAGSGGSSGGAGAAEDSQNLAVAPATSAAIPAATAPAPAPTVVPSPAVPPPTLDGIVTSWLKQQHRQCPAPITTLPPLSLLHPHTCPEPLRSLDAPFSITRRLSARQRHPPYGGWQGKRLDRQLVFSRFRPWRTCREDAVMITSACFLLGAGGGSGGSGGWGFGGGVGGGRRCLAVGTTAGEVKLFDVEGGVVVDGYACHQSPVVSVFSAPRPGYHDDDRGGCGGRGRGGEGSRDGAAAASPAAASASAAYGAASCLLLSSTRTEVKLWDASDLSLGPLHTFPACRLGRFSHSARTIAAVRTEGQARESREVLLYDVATGRLQETLREAPIAADAFAALGGAAGGGGASGALGGIGGGGLGGARGGNGGFGGLFGGFGGYGGFGGFGMGLAGAGGAATTGAAAAAAAAAGVPIMGGGGVGVSRALGSQAVHFAPLDDLLLWNGYLWDPRISEPVHRFDQFSDYGGGGFHPSGNEVIINSEVWDLRTRKLLRSVPSLDQTCITFNTTGEVIYATLRRTSDDLLAALHGRRRKHPLFSAFKTIDATSYTDIATVNVDRCVLDLAIEPTDSYVAVVAVDEHGESDSVARVFEVGRQRVVEELGDFDGEDEGEMEDEGDEGEEEEEDDEQEEFDSLEEELFGGGFSEDLDEDEDEDGFGQPRVRAVRGGGGGRGVMNGEVEEGEYLGSDSEDDDEAAQELMDLIMEGPSDDDPDSFSDEDDDDDEDDTEDEDEVDFDDDEWDRDSDESGPDE
ncbi:hypothetical protein CLOP_g14433 [Closterium sp. NIES-67]|nr:hypothetical protein CLOP_g14433 [Closterium sp. NIES-67]